MRKGGVEWLERIRGWLEERPFRGPEPEEEVGYGAPPKDASEEEGQTESRTS